MGADLVYVVHSEPAVAEKLSSGLQAADYQVVTLTTVDEASSLSSERQFELPDAILTPLGDLESGDSVLIALFLSNPLMEQIPLVVVASSEKEERRRALRLGLLGQGLALAEDPFFARVDAEPGVQHLVEEVADGVVGIEDVLRPDHPVEPVQADHVHDRWPDALEEHVTATLAVTFDHTFQHEMPLTSQ